MSSSSGSASSQYSRHGMSRGCCAKGNWSGINIAAMVVGFVLFWPVGLVILYWNIRGRNVKDLPNAVHEKWSEYFGKDNHSDHSSSKNSIFDEFQQTQYDRVSELKEEIKNRAGSFRDFRFNAKRRADEVEFKDFMSTKPEQKDNE